MESDMLSLFPDLYDSSLTKHYINPGILMNLYDMPNPSPRRQTSTSSSDDSSGFKVLLNVKQFRPDEIKVKTVDDYVVIHGKHEEQADEHGLVSREFTRRYKLPEDVEPEKVVTSLSKEGVLTIKAPGKKLLPPPRNERIVPITIQKTASEENHLAQRQRIEEEQKQRFEQAQKFQMPLLAQKQQFEEPKQRIEQAQKQLSDQLQVQSEQSSAEENK